VTGLTVLAVGITVWPLCWVPRTLSSPNSAPVSNKDTQISGAAPVLNRDAQIASSAVFSSGTDLTKRCTPTLNPDHRGSPFIFIAGVTLFIALLTGVLYWHWGAYSRVTQASLIRESVVQMSDDIKGKASLEALIGQFEKHLNQEPGSAKGWYLLGKLYLRDGRVKEAEKVLAMSNSLNPNDLDTMQALAQALFLSHHNTLNSEAQALLVQVIKKAPDSLAALTLLGTDAYNKHQYNQALSYFEKLLPYYSPDTEEGKRLLEIIAQAQKLRQ
jgi:cytochrome c-type biogenesis protein CcmH